jgi:amino-acid N-acetyltransferase
MGVAECGLKIRRAKPEDQRSIRRLLSDFNLPLDGLEDTKLWVAETTTRFIVGVAGLELYGKQSLLRSVAIDKKLHTRGYGTTLVNYVIDEAKRSGVHELFLLTTTAPSFFRKLGFREDTRDNVSGKITNSVEFKYACSKTAILMRLDLN